MSEAEFDLSGRWSGIFNFPHSLPPGSFEADIRDVAGQISGVTTEAGDDFDPPDTIFDAIIEGHREGASVAFRKIYADELRPDIVHYQGIIQPGGGEVHGEWMIPGEWSGTFLMIRGPNQRETVERRISEEV